MLNNLFSCLAYVDVPATLPVISKQYDVPSRPDVSASLIVIAVVVVAVVVAAIVLLTVVSRKNRKKFQKKDKEV